MNTTTTRREVTATWQSQPRAVQAIRSRLLHVMPLVAAPLRPDQSFAASGGDSIDFVELLCAIETDYGVRLTVDEIAPMQTVAELLLLVDRRATRRPRSLDASPDQS
jgi:acyl carrier protein